MSFISESGRQVPVAGGVVTKLVGRGREDAPEAETHALGQGLERRRLAGPPMWSPALEVASARSGSVGTARHDVLRRLLDCERPHVRIGRYRRVVSCRCIPCGTRHATPEPECRSAAGSSAVSASTLHEIVSRTATARHAGCSKAWAHIQLTGQPGLIHPRNRGYPAPPRDGCRG